MAATTGNEARHRLAGLAALMLGTGLAGAAGTALAQQDEHRGRDNAGPHQQAPAPRAAPAMERGGNGRAPGQWNGQPRAAANYPGAGGGGGGGGGWQSRAPQPGYGGQAQPYRGLAQQPYRGQAYQGQPGGNGAWRGDGDQRRPNGGQWRGGYAQGGYAQGNYGERDYGQRDFGQRGGQWNHGWRQDNRYDWRGYREENRDAFHMGRYYAPYRDYAYNRLGVGFYLQPLFFGSGYWIGDPEYYRLPPAYGPYHWVRYYNDVLLVNTYTGQVADVIYDFFW